MDIAGAANLPTAAQLRALREAAQRASGTVWVGASGRAMMLQRMARAGWGSVDAARGTWTINEAGRALAKTEE